MNGVARVNPLRGRVGLMRDIARGRGSLAVGVLSAALLGLAVMALAGLLDAITSSQTIIFVFGINAIFVVGYQAFVGNTGIISFGHAAFASIGAFAAGIVSVPVALKANFLPGLPGFLSSVEFGMPLAMLTGGLAALIVALIVGVPLMRLVGASAAIATLGLLFIVHNVLNQATSITRGPQTFIGVPPGRATFLWIFGTLTVALVISALLKWSRFGIRARAVRDDPVAADAIGIGRMSGRLWPWVVSAFITGLGGALYAHLLTAFSASSFFLPQVVLVLTMAIVGGLNSISGALIGAVVISVLDEILRKIEGGSTIAFIDFPVMIGFSQFVMAILLLVMLRWRRAGLLGSREVQVDPRPRPSG